MNFIFKRKKAISLCLSLALFFSITLSSLVAKAYTRIPGVTKFSNQYNITVYYSNYYGSNVDFSSYVTQARSAWNSSTARVWFSPVDSQTNANINIGSDNFGNTGWDGNTIPPTILTPNSATMKINVYYYSSSLKGNESECIAHELGHTLGLNHVTDTTSLMTSKGYKGSPTPSQDDINGVNSVY